MYHVNAFDILIHNKKAELSRLSNDYLWERGLAKTTEKLDIVLHKYNFKFFTIQQELYSLIDLNNRLFYEDEELSEY